MLVYLASPYSSENEEKKNLNIEKAKKITQQLMEAGYDVFSPVVYLSLFERGDFLPYAPHSFWLKKCMPYLNASTCVIFFPEENGNLSYGMMCERDLCERVGKHYKIMEGPFSISDTLAYLNYMEI